MHESYNEENESWEKYHLKAYWLVDWTSRPPPHNQAYRPLNEKGEKKGVSWKPWKKRSFLQDQFRFFTTFPHKINFAVNVNKTLLFSLQATGEKKEKQNQMKVVFSI